jgi:hypothetical protein
MGRQQQHGRHYQQGRKQQQGKATNKVEILNKLFIADSKARPAYIKSSRLPLFTLKEINKDSADNLTCSPFKIQLIHEVLIKPLRIRTQLPIFFMFFYVKLNPFQNLVTKRGAFVLI